MKGRHAPVFDVLWGTQASEAAVDHDGKSGAHSLALLHAAGETGPGVSRSPRQGSNRQWDARAERHTSAENLLTFHRGLTELKTAHWKWIRLHLHGQLHN